MSSTDHRAGTRASGRPAPPLLASAHRLVKEGLHRDEAAERLAEEAAGDLDLLAEARFHAVQRAFDAGWGDYEPIQVLRLVEAAERITRRRLGVDTLH